MEFPRDPTPLLKNLREKEDNLVTGKTILFLSLLNITNLNQKNIYTDLIKEFVDAGDMVYIVSPCERKLNEQTRIKEINKRCKILRVKIGNIQKTSLVEKGISTIMLESQILAAIKRRLSDVTFDLVLYATPPVTFQKIVDYIKKRDNATSYLLLKDIFPQNAVDLNKISPRGIIYKYFRSKEKRLYKTSDYIGTMSIENSEYLKTHNSYLDPKKIEVNPNSIKITKSINEVTKNDRVEILSQYGIPDNKLIFLYGGNLGIPQGIDFLLEVLKNEKLGDIHFLIVGSGTEYKKIEAFINQNRLNNVTLIPGLPKNDYQKIEEIADVGLIFLDKRFTIPNIPSRMLGYLSNGKPILAATDKNTDLSTMIEDGEFGLWGLHGDLDHFLKNTALLIDDKYREKMGKNGYKYLVNNFRVEESYKKIIEKLSEEKNV